MAGSYAPKLIIGGDGVLQAYHGISAVRHAWYGTYTFEDSRTDQDGNVWFKAQCKTIGGQRTHIDYELIRISGNGSVFECVLDFMGVVSPLRRVRRCAG